MHTHYCTIGQHVWGCDDNSGDGSDTDCRWFENVTCEEHMKEAYAKIHGSIQSADARRE